MNSRSNPLFSMLRTGSAGVISIFAASTAFAIEPPADNAKPPAELEERAGAPAEIAAKMPFIGVVTASLPDMVADHLNLEKGIGLIVRTVMPKSPADLAGIKVNDVILKINGTAVNDPETFRAEIRNSKIGDKLKLKTIKKGKASDIEVTLAERPADAFADQQNQAPLMLDGVPDAQAQRLRDMIERNLGALGQDGIEEMLIPDPLADEQLQMLRKRMNDALQNAPEIQPEPGKNFQFLKHSTIRMMDENGSVEIKSTGEATEVTVRDKANEIVWSGPWDTEQDKAAAPDEIRERIERMNIRNGGLNGGGLKLQFNR